GDTSASLTTQPTCSTSATAGSPVGTYAITCSGAVDTNYTISYVAGTLTITPATLTVTANDTSRGYGAANPTFTVSYSGFQNGDTSSVLSGSPSCSTTAAASSSVAGSPYPITCTQGTLSATNYTFTFVAGNLTINPVALTITANNQSKAYG